MKRIVMIACFVGCTALFFGFDKPADQPRILVFSKTVKFRHTSIPKGKVAIQKLGAENGYKVDTTEDAAFFTDKSLKNYAGVIFLNTTGDILDSMQQSAFERYIRAGGGYIGIHAAADTEYDWAWYGKLAGAYFESHPKIQQATLQVKDKQHLSTKHLPDQWVRTDEWYNYKNFNKDVHVLITLDEKSYTGGKMGDFHPMAWYQNFQGGRAFYTALGHTDESYTDPNFLNHLLGGIRFAVGTKKT